MSGVPIHCNLLHASAAEARAAERGDITLAKCLGCGLLYNTSFDPRRMEYSSRYENALHHSAHFRRYAERLAADLVERHAIHQGGIAEIGCGDGYFLNLLCENSSSHGVGFDPGGTAVDRGIYQIEATPFDPERLPLDCQLVCSRHVLEHLPEPLAFLQEIRRASSGAAVYLEVPNGDYMLTAGAVWDLLYEHCSYYTAAALTTLCRNAGFAVQRCQPAYGEQFLQIELTIGECPVLTPRRQTAALDGAAGFGDRYQRIARSWELRLRELAAAGRTVALWGAGTKGVMFLNSIEAAATIQTVVDLNPEKHDAFVAGTGHRISTPATLTKTSTDVVVAMNPAYLDEIAAQLSELGLQAEVVCALTEAGNAGAGSAKP